MTKELKEMTYLHKKVFAQLPIGVQSSVSTKELEMMLGIEERYVREIISILIMEYGIPIGSFRHQNNGFFIATSEEEKRIGTVSLNEQVKSMNARLNRVNEADLETALLYREKYKDELIPCQEQSTIYEYIKEAGAAESVTSI